MTVKADSGCKTFNVQKQIRQVISGKQSIFELRYQKLTQLSAMDLRSASDCIRFSYKLSKKDRT